MITGKGRITNSNTFYLLTYHEQRMVPLTFPFRCHTKHSRTTVHESCWVLWHMDFTVTKSAYSAYSSHQFLKMSTYLSNEYHSQMWNGKAKIEPSISQAKTLIPIVVYYMSAYQVHLKLYIYGILSNHMLC